MRQIDPKILQERKDRVLHAVIHQFIKTAHPVGSSMLTEEYEFDLSPATIRNLMAELEEEGYLTHPHTSAGRIPTDKGYRSYVDSLIELQRLVVEEENRVRQEYDGRIRELQELLVKTSHILSGLSQYTGFVLTPRVERNQLQYIELIPFADKKILVILVTTTGMVKHRMVQASVSRERLNELNRYLNIRLKGLSFSEARQRVVEAIQETEREERAISQLAQNLCRDVFSIEEEVYLGGTSNVLTLPEFHDFEPMRSLLRLNEDSDLLREILDHGEEEEGVRVIIGSETLRQEFKELSVVSSIYKDGEHPVGVLGIIGPKRMEYPRMMALVSAVSRMVNRLLSNEKKGGAL